MTDLETMLLMLDKAGIQFETEVKKDQWRGRVIHSGTNNTVERRLGFVTLTIERGYHNFVSEIIFDSSGTLVSIEAYE